MNSTTCPECGAALKPGTSLCPACLLSAGAATLPIQPVSAGITTLPCEFGDYRLLKKLGAGGMGIVYEAEQISSGRRLALKVLNQCLDNEEQRQRFLREGRLAATIDHPNSVYVFGTEEIEGVPVIAMELAAGGTLRDELKRRGTMPVRDAVDAILGIIDGLEAAHARGVLHRDMKPSNCFVSGDGTAIVGDYGLSISQTNNLPDAEQLTRSGMVMGTPAFSPPEQLRAQPLDQRADIYSTGGTLFYLLTGKAPVERSTPVETVAAVLEGKIPNVRTLRPEVPEDLAAVIARCLAADVTKRPASYAELRLALLPFSSQVPEPAPLGTRLAAGFIDSLITMMVVVPLIAVLPMIAQSWMLDESAGGDPLWISAIDFLLQLGFYLFCESRWGATPGKWILGITVADLRGGIPSRRQALGRALLYVGIPAAAAHLTNQFFPHEVMGEVSQSLQVALAVFMVVFILNLQLLLFIPALHRRDRAAWHDAITGTRVVLARHMPERMRTPDALAGEPSHETQHWGPFEGIARLADGSHMARDPVLRRRVMLTPRNRGDAPSAARRACARASRLRWLQGVTDASGAKWDTWQVPAGAPLLQVIETSSPTWQQALSWLRDLSLELSAAEKDGTMPAALSLAQVWLTTDGRAILLDHAWPGTRSEEAAISAETAPAQAAQTFLHHMASLCPPVTRPVHADTLMTSLAAASFERLSHVSGNVVHLLQQKHGVSTRSRAAALFAPILVTIGMLVFFMMMTQKFIDTAWTTPYPGLPLLPEVIKMYEHTNRPGAKDMPSGLKEHIRQHLAGHYALFFTKNAPVFPERHRVTLAEILDSTPPPSAPVLTAADAAVRAALPRFQALHPEHSSAINLTKAVPVTTFGMLCVLMLWQFVCILVVGSPLQMHLSGIAAVTGRDRPATRLRMLWRWCIGWSVLLVIVAVPIVRTIKGVDVVRRLPEFSQIWVPVIIMAALCGLLLPRRTLVDRLAGTWLVAR
jgi:uncharacterized RDD family membrane protein YckC